MGRPPLKREAIERSALELFVEKGVDGTSIRDIAVRAGVTEGALYRHHASKDDLVRYLFFQHYAGFAEIIKKIEGESLAFTPLIERLVQEFYEFYDRDPDVFRFVMLVRHKLLEHARADETNPVELLTRLFKGAATRGDIPKQDTDLLTQLVLGMVLQVAVGVQFQRVKSPLAQYAKRTAKLILIVAKTP